MSSNTTYNHTLQLGAALDLSADAIISIDESQTILMFNKGAERIFGYSQKEVIGKSLTNLMPNRYRDNHQADVHKFSSSNQNSKLMAERSEVFGLKKDGTEFPAETSISKLEVDGKKIFVAVLRDITDRKKTDLKLRASLKEKEVLLQEVHHRVKNNLQVISSLLNLQADKLKTKEAIDAILEAQGRVKSISLIHERLYRSGNFASINFDEYIKELAERLLQSYTLTKDISLKIEKVSETLSLEQAIPTGLIINELITNSLKHGFEKKREGEIEINFSKDSKNNFLLEISDNGKGLAKDFDILESDTLGMQLILSLSSQIEGNIDLINNNPGLKVRITFPSEDKT